MNVDVTWLREIPLLSEFSDEDLATLAEVIQREEVPEGTVLFHEGEKRVRFAMVLRGEIEIIRELGTPQEHLLRAIGPGGFLGEMSLLDPKGTRTASARVISALEWAQINRQDFFDLHERHPGLALRFLQAIMRNMRISETAIIGDLRAKNQELEQAYEDLKRAQASLIEKEKLEHELEIARVIQMSILPKQIPDVPGWQIHAHWQPARSVSGDFYDLFPFENGMLGILIADVTGKGMPAALVMATMCSMVRAVAGPEVSPGSLLERVNQLLVPYMPHNMFVTCLYGNLDPASGKLRFANAGHCLPMCISSEKIVELRATGMPLGLLPDMDYEEKEALLQQGEGLLLYTDGLVEAHNPQREMFGIPNLRERLVGISAGPRAIADLLAHLEDFTGPGWEQEDDVTLVWMSRG